MNLTTADEVERLRHAEFDAERRHIAALKRGDLRAVRHSADNWTKASNAFTKYTAAHPDLYRDGN